MWQHPDQTPLDPMWGAGHECPRQEAWRPRRATCRVQGYRQPQVGCEEELPKSKGFSARARGRAHLQVNVGFSECTRSGLACLCVSAGVPRGVWVLCGCGGMCMPAPGTTRLRLYTCMLYADTHVHTHMLQREAVQINLALRLQGEVGHTNLATAPRPGSQPP